MITAVNTCYKNRPAAIFLCDNAYLFIEVYADNSDHHYYD